MTKASPKKITLHLFFVVIITAICLSMLLFVCFSLFLIPQKISSTQGQINPIPTTPRGYVFPYPDLHMLYPVIAIAPATSNCSPEYAKKPDLLSFTNVLTNHSLPYYQGSNVSAGVWEKDAVLIATSIGFNLVSGRVVGSSDVYTSSCSNHILVTIHNFLTEDQGNDTILTKTDPFIAFVPGIIVNTTQIPFNEPLWAKGISGFQTEPSFALAHCNCQTNSGPQAVRVNGQTIYTDQYTIQTNRSKKYGLLYQVIYQRENKVIAQVSYQSDGTVVSYTAY